MEAHSYHYYGCDPHEIELVLTEREWSELRHVKAKKTFHSPDGTKYIIRLRKKSDGPESEW